ncbi:uncharacterized protein LOC115332094 [Ixodes scapularis]|uniref:uncharacterized protein LOC115332094 n=1 Tax=Ixodes scapularis TaxID=6945 RepID=UPI001A9FF671|nr:uncharacterized protein LOC115332094 [Ixodes scapularis]
MGACSVIGCRNRTGFSSAGVTFHRFPTVAELRQRWISAVGRSGGWTPSKWSVVCSVHFHPADRYRSISGRCRPKGNAVPSMALPVQNTASVTVDDGNDCHRLGVCVDVAEEVEVVADEPTEASYSEPEEVEILGHETASVLFSKPSAAATDVSKPSTSSDMAASTTLRDAPEGEPTATEVVVEPTDSSYIELEVEIREDETGLAELGAQRPLRDTPDNEYSKTEAQPADDTSEEAFLRKELTRYRNLQTASKKKIKTLQQSERRLKKKLARMQDLLDNLTKSCIWTDENVWILESLGKANKDLLRRRVAKKTGAPQAVTYSPELQASASSATRPQESRPHSVHHA